jgi:tRNA threonylcarbamoyladenosine biosynthesis protein TsaB
LRVLAVDTTSDRGSVALVEAGSVRAETGLVAGPGHGHAEQLLPAIQLLLSQNGLELRELQGYAVAIGPGSFTGLRVGISSVQGLALAGARLCCGVSALDALGQQARRHGRPIAVMIDAFRDEVFAARYSVDGTTFEGPALLTPQAFVEGVPPGAAYLGSGVDRYADLVLAHDASALLLSPAPLLAGSVGLLAAERFAGQGGMAPESLRPLYVRDAGIWRRG